MKRKYRITSAGELFFSPATTYIGGNAFSENQTITKVVVPATVKSIDNYAFANCRNLQEVKFERGSACETILEGAFGGCVSLARVRLPLALRGIGNEAFYNCVALEEITIPHQCETVGNKALWGCRKLKSANVMCPRAVLGQSVFGDCSAIKKMFIYGKEYEAFNSFRGTMIYLCKHPYWGLEFCTVKQVRVTNGKEIVGKTHRVCRGVVDGELFVGEGENAREAYEDFVFYVGRESELNSRKGWTTQTLLSARDYRLLSGSCLFGTRVFLRHKNIDADKDRWPMERIANEVDVAPFNKDSSVQAFLTFYNQLKEREASGAIKLSSKLSNKPSKED